MAKQTKENSDSNYVKRSSKEKTSESGFDPVASQSYGGYPQSFQDIENLYLMPGLENETQQPTQITSPLAPFHIVKDKETLWGIAINCGVNLQELCSANNIQIINAENGLINWNGEERTIIAGDILVIPAKSEEIDTQTANLLANDAVKKAEPDKDMDSFFVTLLQLSSNFLGPTNGSKISYAFSVNIPFYAGLDITFSGSFEQERKNGEVIEHKTQLGVGFAAKLKDIIDAKITFNVHLTAQSAQLKQAGELFSYGFYKFGRQIADTGNDWHSIALTSGASAPASTALYYGLNIMYSAEHGLTDTSGAEKNISDKEASLFGKTRDFNKPFDESNSNEVAFGSSMVVGAEVGDDSIGAKAGVGAEVGYQNVINAHTLNTTKIYGEQKNQGLFKDYDLGSKQELSVKEQVDFAINKYEASYSTTATYDKIQKQNKSKIKSTNNDWQFSKMESEAVLTLKDLSAKNNISNEVVSQAMALAESIKDKYITSGKSATKFDSNATIKEINFTSMGTNIAAAIARNSLSKVPGCEVTDALQIKIKITSEGEKEPIRTLTIGHLTGIKQDFIGKAEVELTNFTPLTDFEI